MFPCDASALDVRAEALRSAKPLSRGQARIPVSQPWACARSRAPRVGANPGSVQKPSATGLGRAKLLLSRVPYEGTKARTEPRPPSSRLFEHSHPEPRRIVPLRLCLRRGIEQHTNRTAAPQPIPPRAPSAALSALPVLHKTRSRQGDTFPWQLGGHIALP